MRQWMNPCMDFPAVDAGWATHPGRCRERLKITERRPGWLDLRL